MSSCGDNIFYLVLFVAKIKTKVEPSAEFYFFRLTFGEGTL